MRNSNELVTSYPDLCLQIIDSFFYCTENKWFDLGGFVLMPDHYHLLFRLGNIKSLDEIMHSLNSFTSKQAVQKFNLKTPFWQENYFEHVVRNDESFARHVSYIEQNPVRKELVATPEAWQYSSANETFKKRMDRSWIYE